MVEKNTNQFDGEIHDYTRKGSVVHTEILLPDHAPAAFSDRAVLWNAVEKIEKAKNAQLAKENVLALPRELTREQGISIVREYVKRHFVASVMCADVCLHDTGGGTPHVQIMLTMRPIEQGGAWSAKQKEYILDWYGTKSMLPKSGNTSASPFPLPTGTTGPKPRNGGRRGRSFAIKRWGRTDTPSVSTSVLIFGS